MASSRALDIAGLPSLQDFGFTGGRDSFKAFCRAVFQNPDPRFLRTDQGTLVVFRHADLRAFGTAKEIGNVPIGKLYPGRLEGGKASGMEVAKVISSQVFTFNPPLHTSGRQILTNWLGPKQVSLMEAVARDIAQQIIVGFHDGQEIDFVQVVANRMTVGFWSRLLRLTEAEEDAIDRCTHEMTRLFHLDRSTEDAVVLDAAFAEYAAILDVAANRGLASRDPMVSELANRVEALADPDDPVNAGRAPKSLGDYLAGNLVDGFHTAALASANTFYALARNPDILAEIKGSPVLMARAVAEALRLEPPVLFLKRFVLQDFEYEGAIIPAGSIVTMLWAAGNYDPAAFPDPERFDLARRHAGLMTFGTGIHICPGRHAGVMLIRVMIEAFEANGIEFELAQAPAEWLPDHMLCQLSLLPMRMRRARAGVPTATSALRADLH